MASVRGVVQSAVQNVHEAVTTPVKNELVAGVKEAATTIISGPSRISPQEKQQIAKRQQEVISRRFYLKRWLQQQAAGEQQIRLADAAKKNQQQQVEADAREKAHIQQFEVTDKPILQIQSKKVPGIPGGSIQQKRTAPERTRKAA